MADAPLSWRCPVCGRQIPARVATCFCGVSREQALKHAQKEREEQRETTTAARGPLRFVALGLLLLLAIAGSVLLREAGEMGLEPAPVASPPPEPALPREPPLRVAPMQPLMLPQAPPPPVEAPPGPATPEPAPAAAATEAPAPPASPSASPSPEERDERERAREEALKALEQALASAAARSRELAARLRQHEDNCVGQRAGAVVASNCGSMVRDAQELAAGVQAGIDQAEEAARRAAIPPGEVRSARARHGLEGDWDALRRRAAALPR